MIRLLAILLVVVPANAAFGQQSAPATAGSGADTAATAKSIGDLLSDGYEIKASAPTGTKFIVFLQKDKSAYACEFVSVTRSRCGSIN